ncbi:MAG: FprA family A-type flavoprotein [Candidatus Caldatribacterium sp.]|nr:FprA family A-type flavoprotein [Candidatus Caldatribacterium sp.]
MPSVEIRPGVYWVGVNDHTTDLFEGLWPITKEGVSYNSYLVVDEKKAIIDLAKSLKTDDFIAQIEEKVPLSSLDYIVLNHMEPDHTGTLKVLRKLAPQAVILCSPQAKDMVAAFYGIAEGVQVVQDGEKVELGRKKLVFFLTPMVHWPETMVTYEEETKTLFSCDAFGGYGALQGAIFDDECTQFDFYVRESLRYFANIVAKYSPMVLKAIDKLSTLSISMIAPSHGLIWRKNPQYIVDLCRTWSQYAENGGEKGVTILYGSMYGNTEAMVDALAQGIAESGVRVDMFDARRVHASYILASLWEKKGVVIGAPTYEAGLFPPVAQVLDLALRKSVKHKKMLYLGSFGWSGGARREVERFARELNWEVVSFFEFRGGGKKEDILEVQKLGREFGKLIQGLQ